MIDLEWAYITHFPRGLAISMTMVESVTYSRYKLCLYAVDQLYICLAVRIIKNDQSTSSSIYFSADSVYFLVISSSHDVRYIKVLCA
jgi:hypothetical protein